MRIMGLVNHNDHTFSANSCVVGTPGALCCTGLLWACCGTSSSLYGCGLAASTRSSHKTMKVHPVPHTVVHFLLLRPSLQSRLLNFEPPGFLSFSHSARGAVPKVLYWNFVLPTLQTALDRTASGLMRAGFPSVQLNDAHSDKERLAATPAYVISGKEERWEHSRSVLATLHITAERVWPPKPSLHLARTMFAFHDHDKQASMADEHHQRYMSLLAAWRQALGHIAHRPDLAPDEWALVFEDDISLHDDLTLSAARAAILRGFSLARADGWLYLGVCLADGDGQGCLESTAEVHDGVKYAKCIGLCSHALAFTQRKAGTMLADMHAGMKRFMDLYGSYPSAPTLKTRTSCSWLGSHLHCPRW